MLSCLVPLKSLYKAPWLLKKGDLIIVRAQAVNSFGPGLASPTKELKLTAAVMIAELPTVEAPKVVSQVPGALKIEWKHPV